MLYFSKEENHLITGKKKFEGKWLRLGLELGLELRVGLFFVLYFCVLYFSCCIFPYSIYIDSTEI